MSDCVRCGKHGAKGAVIFERIGVSWPICRTHALKLQVMMRANEKMSNNGRWGHREGGAVHTG
jgi:hypothetical protein